MTVGRMKDEIMFQTNNDADDVADYVPYLLDYINEGYDRLVYAWAGVHPSDDDAVYKPLHGDHEEPATPPFTHRALADYATYLLYRNGNPQKQQRGYVFLSAFNEVVSRIISEGGAKGRVRNFFNIPR